MTNQAKPALSIRPGQPADAEHLIAFNQAMALETEQRSLASEQIEPGVRKVLENANHGFYVVAETAGESQDIAGALMVTFEWSDWRNGMFWWIQSVYVRPPYRGNSIYTRLYDYVRERAREQGGVCGFRLYVEKENRHAQAVYQALGMQETHYLMYEEELH